VHVNDALLQQQMHTHSVMFHYQKPVFPDIGYCTYVNNINFLYSSSVLLCVQKQGVEAEPKTPGGWGDETKLMKAVFEASGLSSSQELSSLLYKGSRLGSGLRALSSSVSNIKLIFLSLLLLVTARKKWQFQHFIHGFRLSIPQRALKLRKYQGKRIFNKTMSYIFLLYSCEKSIFQKTLSKNKILGRMQIAN